MERETSPNHVDSDILKVEPTDQQNDEIETVIDDEVRLARLGRATSVFVHTIVVNNITNVTALHRFEDIVLEHFTIRLKHLGGLLVERIFGVRFLKEGLISVNFATENQCQLTKNKY